MPTSKTPPQLTEPTILGIIGRYDVAAAATIARRADLSNVVLAKLFQMNSRKVYRALAANTAIVPRGAYLSALARSAQMDHMVAESLAKRDDFDTALLAPAFFDLSDEDRIKVIHAFAHRETPAAPIKRTIEQISVASADLTKALMKLFSENRRPEVTKLLIQITGLDEVRCGQIAHDMTGASLFVVLRAFGATAYDGLKVLIHATAQDSERSKALADYATLFGNVIARFDGLPDERLARRSEPARTGQARIPALHRHHPPRAGFRPGPQCRGRPGHRSPGPHRRPQGG